MVGPKYHIRKLNIFIGIKVFLFVALIVTVTYLYAVDIYTKFLDNATTFKSKIEKTKYSIMPPITICMENGLKTSVMKKYGLGNIMEFHYNVENLTSVWDTFFEASYKINRDFNISFRVNEFIGPKGNKNEMESIHLETGDIYWNDGFGNIYEITVQEHIVNYAGACYEIASNMSISPSNMIKMTLQFDGSLNQLDLPPVSTKHNLF